MCCIRAAHKLHIPCPVGLTVDNLIEESIGGDSWKLLLAKTVFRNPLHHHTLVASALLD